MTDITPDDYFSPDYFSGDYFGGGGATGFIAASLTGTGAVSAVLTATGEATESTGGGFRRPRMRNFRGRAVVFKGLTWVEQLDEARKQIAARRRADELGEPEAAAPAGDVKQEFTPPQGDVKHEFTPPKKAPAETKPAIHFGPQLDLFERALGVEKPEQGSAEVERQVHNLEVVGSIPTPATNTRKPTGPTAVETPAIAGDELDDDEEALTLILAMAA